MDHRPGWSLSQYRGDVVLRHEKPDHALMVKVMLSALLSLLFIYWVRWKIRFEGRLVLGPNRLTMYSRRMVAGERPDA
jgi:hypothetical protein